MPLFDTVKLGKQARKHLFRTAMLQDHTASTAPAPPAAWDLDQRRNQLGHDAQRPQLLWEEYSSRRRR